MHATTFDLAQAGRDPRISTPPALDRITLSFAIAGLLLALPAALYYGFSLGGALGSAYGKNLLGDIGIRPGTQAGFAALFVAIEFAALLVFAAGGKLLALLIRYGFKK